MMKQKTKAVEGLTKGIETLFRKNKVDYIKGHGTIASPNEVAVKQSDGSTRVLRSKHIIIATGSEPVQFPGLKASFCWTDTRGFASSSSRKNGRGRRRGVSNV
jgi:dihydrolipoamide dehydrogenase